MRALILLHRWLGVAFCLLFAMWFATGIVMHFVPFPSLAEAERVAGLAPVDVSAVRHGPAEVVEASKLAGVSRIRLIAEPDGPVYVVSGAFGVAAYRASDLGNVAIVSDRLALRIAVDHARRRGLDVAKAAVAERADYDQWTVPNRFDPHRPMFRVALKDAAGTDLYVSSVTGEVLLQTVRHERLWNYAGSVVHWIYPTVLRSNWAAWDKVVWWLSLVALTAAASGALLGTIRVRKAWRRIVVSMRSWHAWHHVLGLLTMTFILTWSISGWLSMDHGRIFSRGMLTVAEKIASAAKPGWTAMNRDALRHISPGAVEIEWFALGDVIYQRERTGPSTQVLRRIDGGTAEPFLSAGDIGRWVSQFAGDCRPPDAIRAGDNYAAASAISGAPVYRATCGDVWFHIDGASGLLLERLDPSRRAYRWFYSALHTMDVPVLLAHPLLRSGLIVGLCMLGFIFSATGVVLGWRRLRMR